MDDFDFGYTDRPERTREMATMPRYEQQGFSPPYGESPVQNPPGWYEGGLENTGGNIYARTWYTLPYDELFTPAEHGSVEYMVGYNQNPRVFLDRLQYNNVGGSYGTVDTIESFTVDENTDYAKAQAALRLMQKYP
jgi:hypothetical protein